MRTIQPIGNTHLCWEDTFCLMSKLIALRSKDPDTKVGSVIVNDQNIVVGLGYNGFPRGCDDQLFPWTRKDGINPTDTMEDSMLRSKYTYVVHAEVNAILNSNGSTKDCTLYCTLFPCNECAKIIIQAGIKRIIYLENKYADMPMTHAAVAMFRHAGVKTEQYILKSRMEL